MLRLGKLGSLSKVCVGLSVPGLGFTVSRGLRSGFRVHKSMWNSLGPSTWVYRVYRW